MSQKPSSLDGKIALVTGASRGIGRAIAQRFAAEGAAAAAGGRYIPEDYPTEPVEYLVETALALCRLPARECTGLVTHSLHFPMALQLPVYTLDGRERLPEPQIPAWAHSEIDAEGW